MVFLCCGDFGKGRFVVEVLGRVGFGVKGLGMAGLHVGSFLKLGSLFLGSFYKGAVLYWDLIGDNNLENDPCGILLLGLWVGVFDYI